ncbi:hypothetical protein D3C76_1057150 [compost metagenome]
MRCPLPGNGQARVVTREQLAKDIVTRAAYLAHLHQRRADQVGHHHHLQRIGLLDQRHAKLLGSRNDRRRHALDKAAASENHHAGDAHCVAIFHQAQQVGLAARVVDASDEHQFTAHYPFGNAFVFRHIRPAHPPLKVTCPGQHTHLVQARQMQDLVQRQAHGSTPAWPGALWRAPSSSRAM